MIFQEAILHTTDILVLGAGIVGVSTAVHLRRRGLNVVLIDRRHPGEETSFGNAGIVERNGFVPPSIPLNPAVLLEIALNQSTAVVYSPKTLVGLLPWLRAFQKNAARPGVQRHAHAVAPLRARAVAEHQDLARQANAQRFYRKSGWLHLYRTASGFADGETERHYARIFGVDYQELMEGDIPSVEPGLRTGKLWGVLWPQSESVSNPAAVTEAIWRAFIQSGGSYFIGDARALRRERGQWLLETQRTTVSAPHAVLSLGPWSGALASSLGETFPVIAKRGYHLHFRPPSGESLSRPVVDMQYGFVLTPMERGIRLTTGVDFSDMDAPPRLSQIARAQMRANEIFPLGQPVEDKPWMGSRPCLPDSLPVVGPSSVVPGLWYNFGHGHSGFTLGPLTGRLIADLIVGQTPCTDIAPLHPDRFKAGQLGKGS